MDKSAHVNNPMTTCCKLSDDDESPSIDSTLYVSMIGILLYLIASKPKIMQEVGMLPIFQSSPKESHVMAIKIIFR